MLTVTNTQAPCNEAVTYPSDQMYIFAWTNMLIGLDFINNLVPTFKQQHLKKTNNHPHSDMLLTS